MHRKEEIWSLRNSQEELAYFVQQALASGTYQSADEFVVEAVRLLKTGRPSARLVSTPRGPSTHGRLNQHARRPGDAIRLALGVGEAGRARELALKGAQRYPAHAELHTWPRGLLAPPPTRSRARVLRGAGVSQGNGVWLKAHRTAYHGRWIALCDGALVRVADSFEALVADLGDTTGLLLTKVV